MGRWSIGGLAGWVGQSVGSAGLSVGLVRRSVGRSVGSVGRAVHFSVSVGTSFIGLKSVVKDVVILGVVFERRTYCYVNKGIVYLLFTMRRLSGTTPRITTSFTTSFRHMKDVPY